MFIYNAYEIVDKIRNKNQMIVLKDLNERTHLLLPENPNRKYSKLFFIPQRYVMGIMGFLAVVNAYTMRVSLSVAITEMAFFRHNETTNDNYNACFGESFNNTRSFKLQDEVYNWSDKHQGIILSGFYWGYVITQVPGGILAEKFGGKYVLGIGILFTSIFTFITPLVIRISNGSWLTLVILRVIIGLAEGPTYPALTTILSKWVPLAERSTIGTLVYAGCQIGTIVGNFFSGVLIQNFQSWAIVFYFFGAIGILWTILWSIFCYSDPESHPFISESERQFLRKEMPYVTNKAKVIPWQQMILSLPVWALIFAQIGHDWGFLAMVSDLPKYLKEILKFNVKENGIWSSVPYLSMWIVSMLSGFICDWLISTNRIGLSQARKLFTTIASIGPAIFLVLAAYAGCDRSLAIWLFTIAMGLMGTFYSGMKVNPLDLSPNFAGALMSLVNGIGALTGIIVPYLIAAVTQDHTIEEWRIVFWITFGVFFVTNGVYVLFASGDIQPFDLEAH